MRHRVHSALTTAIALAGYGCLDRVTLVRHSADASDAAESSSSADRATTDDATDDRSSDGGDETTADAAGLDAPTPDAAANDAGPAPEAPRLIAPLSTSFLTGGRPTLRWRRSAGTERTLVQVCADRACTRVEDSRSVSGDQLEWPTALSAGTHYWRAFGQRDDRLSAAPSATWQFHVARGMRARTSAWGSFTDFNGDGFGDAAIGAPEARARAGLVQVHLGGRDSIAQAESAMVFGSAGRFGFAAASVGDVNGDGFGDLAIAAPDDNGEAGSVFVMFGSAQGIDPMAARTHIAGRSAGDHFGSSIAAAGDLDGDGYGDVVIGAPTANSAQGRAWVYFGAPGGLSGGGVELIGEREPAAQFGGSVTGACDLDGDGLSDLVIGSPTGRAGSGVAYLYRGSGSRTLSARTAIEPVAPSDWFGFSVTRAGDVNGDGACDLVIGAPNSGGGRGAAHVYAARADWSGASATLSLSGPAQSQGFGYAIAEARDLDGDGLDDLAVGAPGDAAASYVYVFRGSSSGAVEPAPWSTTTLPAQINRFGRAVGGRADFNGDGYFDLIVGEPEWGALGGRVMIVHGGASAMSVARRFVSTFGGFFGGAVAQRFIARSRLSRS
ncbi:MAG: FG-GAP-like repeat-containing protein [Polyangiales bacterium]